MPSFLGVPIIVNKVEEVAGRTVVVRWEPLLEGACPIVGYNVYYREVPTRKDKWNSVTVNRNAINYTLYLDCWKQYEIAVTSLATYGESPLSDSHVWKVLTIGGDNCCFNFLNDSRSNS